MKTNKPSALSPMEQEILSIFHDQFRDRGFPTVESVQVLERKNTGAGRVVLLTSDAVLTGADGYLDMNGRYIEMEGIPNGLAAVISIANAKLDQLEISVYGDDSWNGEESRWKIV